MNHKKVRFTQESIDRKEKPKFDSFSKPQNERESTMEDVLFLLSQAEESVNKLKIKTS